MSNPYRTASPPEPESVPRDGFAAGVVLVIFAVGVSTGGIVGWSLKPASVVEYRKAPCETRIEPLNNDTATHCDGEGAVMELTRQGEHDYLVCRCPVVTDGGVR